MAPEKRVPLHVWLTEPSLATLTELADEEGISVAALIEALATDFAAVPPAEGGHPRWAEISRSARKIAAGRRRRR